LKVLDFKKISKKERDVAVKLFGEGNEKKTFEIIESKKLTNEEVLKIKDAISKATTMTEISKYEEALKLQKMPKELI
jgi:uncharacterized protein YcgL (UPF0745 family)